MAISKTQARELAIFYNAFNDIDMGDYHQVVLWGSMLLEAQTKTKIELHANEWLERTIAFARKREERQTKISAFIYDLVTPENVEA